MIVERRDHSLIASEMRIAEESVNNE